VGDGVTDYPRVLSEIETLRRVVDGASLARFGDGEFKMCRIIGCSIKSEVGGPDLSARLRGILRDSGRCLVAIPDVHANGPKAERWRTFWGACEYLSDREYGSAFVSRPDSAPWIDTDEYWDLMASLWRGQTITLVRGSGKSFTKERLLADGARDVVEIEAPKVDAWSHYGELMELIGKPTRAILCVGPTATVMAVDLCAKGVHAIDLGHAGMYWKRRQVAA
jgi:hypothetical protein